MPERPASFRSRLDRGIENITVDHWGPPIDAQDAAGLVAAFYLSTWGDPRLPSQLHTDRAWEYAQLLADGKALPNALEAVSMAFGFNGISRATTHQLVRSRVGVSFGQQGGRDNDWSDFNLRQPPTFDTLDDEILERVVWLREYADGLYQALLARGVPTQDARYILPMGLETALVGTYNLLALKGTLQRRLCNRMMWETNYVARVMADRAIVAFPWFGRNMRANCQRGTCASVSTMFPPADLVAAGGSPDASYAKDSPTIADSGEVQYEWGRDQNGCYLLFDEVDRRRIRNEFEWAMAGGGRACYSLVDGSTLLTVMDDDGLWRKYEG